ncbi:hypothetical protein QBC38DRAFT_223105 [Podospora fimiseda]|uniref:Transmembrane protein n=1 Tax=Podospora fimiseda TaxID=252190 RepID=A0AAN7H7R4_9PEZI|nr:hypothetical protein QBC38DRAFT_223105 [Podospora fimiseda]
MSNPILPIPPNKGDSTPKPLTKPSILFTIYSWISTPFLILSFILSLILIDLRNSARRAHFHADSSSRMPGWLHRVIYRYKPYKYVVDPKDGKLFEKDRVKEEEEFYHSHQKKLAKMEMAEAFEMRGIVICFLGLVVCGIGWVGWKGVCVVWGVLRG